MENEPDVLAGALTRIDLTNAPFQELDATQYVRDILPPARREVVEDPYGRPVCEEGIDEVRADESSSASDQNAFVT
jgi:hypothetical protein